MINLLPPLEKEELLIKKNERLIVVLGSMFLIPTICLVLVLFSLKFYILGEVVSQSTILENIEKKYQTPDFLSSKELVQKYNLTLIKADDFYKKQIYLSDALKSISEIQRPEGLYLTNINIKRIKDNGKFNVAISGMSDTRDNLLIFKDNLENNKKIENIYFSPDYLTRPFDINFNLTFEINNEDQR